MDEKLVAIRGDVPESLRVRFKVACAERKVTINETLAKLVEGWIDNQAFEPNRNPHKMYHREATRWEPKAQNLPSASQDSGDTWRGSDIDDEAKLSIINFFFSLFDDESNSDLLFLDSDTVKKIAGIMKIDEERFLLYIKTFQIIKNHKATLKLFGNDGVTISLMGKEESRRWEEALRNISQRSEDDDKTEGDVEPSPASKS